MNDDSSLSAEYHKFRSQGRKNFSKGLVSRSRWSWCYVLVVFFLSTVDNTNH